MLLLDVKKMNEIDTQGMYKVYDRWPEIARKAYESDLEPAHFDGIDHIVFAGMGGSGAIGDLFASILSKTNIHVNVVKGYLLPKTVGKNSLVVCTSISGNTVETLTVLESAKKLGCKIIAFSSGGKMESFCNQNSIEYRKIPMVHSPRASFVSFVYAILHVLDSILPIQKNDVLDSIEELDKTSQNISSLNLSKSNPSLNLAMFLDGPPCIYYPYGLVAAATRFKNSLQENTKMHAFVEDIIEACHNGIVSWEITSNIRPVLLRGTEDFVKTKERWEIVKQYFDENKIDFVEIVSIQGNILSKLLHLIYLLDFASIYRSILSDIDPSTISSIDYIKKKLDHK
ncbi:MAG: SIS domain-containing protein [Nitrosarchaeum sp.]|nr:SIS domain-containing protein [Nitrosarchaeum sp.]